MLAISDENCFIWLEFVDRRGLEREIERLRIKAESAIIPGSTELILMIEEILNCTFNGTLQKFNTPI